MMSIKLDPQHDATGQKTDSSSELKEHSIVIRHLNKKFKTRYRDIVVLENLNLSIRRGEFFVIVGPSGCGKTTLLRILAGLEREYDGYVMMSSRDTSRPLFSMVFQEQSVFPWMTVRQNIEYGLRLRGIPSKQRAEIVATWVDKVGLTRFVDSYPHQLSGGMKQRVSLARAFATDPEILLMDEPFSALDEQNKTILGQELLRIWEKTGKTVVFITHSIDEAITLGDRILIMTASPGRVKEIISVPFSRPRNVIEIRSDPRYGQLVSHIWGILSEEVQQSRSKEVGAT